MGVPLEKSLHRKYPIDGSVSFTNTDYIRQQQSNKFEEIKNKIYDLLSQRSKILSGTLPVDELKRVTKQATEAIDEGNKTLGLDLVVRDKDGNIIDPDVTSTIQLYYHHKNATERMSSRSKVRTISEKGGLASMFVSGCRQRRDTKDCHTTVFERLPPFGKEFYVQTE